ncbi:hypothetical protein Q5424_16040 [Conexibacter sp. JD483]|uniref:hypothetical protein n=1 Tax=unclassified Conexibacter TaxID=2627773 RepID=UPI002723A5AC|nr:MULTISPECIES: hypothetical protein [unclassified Conexibacter]MDO8186650.1 hypothetical protein [Conexibacter sp. CPCC 205706]MDO8200370.1 hypothetical protein [Conexibacter sp. CPCC 205762]MDR9370608.1 hypothetical protein [Conexibacter sp. JD483]
MSEALVGFGDLFAVSASAPATRRGSHPRPTVAVLTAAAAPQPAAAAVALALAAACGTRSALTACVAGAPPSGLLHLPASVAAAARLRRDDLPARACGRLVWLASDRDAAPADGEGAGGDPAGAETDAARAGREPAGGDPGGADADAAESLGAALVRAARKCGLPAVIGIGGARSDQLDRALVCYDGVVVVLPAAAATPLAAATLESLALLGLPAAAMPAPRRLDAAAALAGLRAPRAAVVAVVALSVREGLR